MQQVSGTVSRFLMVGFFAVAGLLAMNAHAGCNPEGNPPTLSGELRSPFDNSVLRMDHYAASGSDRNSGEKVRPDICESLGVGHLPTACELALFAKSRGAEGVRETAYPGMDSSAPVVQVERTQMNSDHYYPIYTKNSAGQTAVDFYFNYTGYQREQGDLGNYWFWSSSVHPDVSSLAYVLDGYIGVIYYDNRSYDFLNAVRCAR